MYYSHKSNENILNRRYIIKKELKMEKNLNPDISKINMETSKKVAESMSNWEGLNASSNTVASSYLNGSTAQMIKESKNSGISPKSKENVVFSFGLVNTIAALKNSTFNDLPAGKILLEKYEYLLINKGISEAFIIEDLIGDLKSFSWENAVTPVLENVSNIFDNRRREIEVLKTYESIKNAPGRELFSDATIQMKTWLLSDTRSTDSLVHGIKRFGFNPMVRNLIGFLSIHESKNSGKFNIGFDNENCEVLSVYSPIHVNENETMFFASEKFLKINEADGSLVECQEVPEELQNKAGMIVDRDVKIENNKISLKLGNSKLDVVFEGETKTLYFDSKKINESDLPVAVSITTNNLLESSNNKISKALFVAKTAEEIVDLDFGKKIRSKVYEGVEANIFKIKDKIYVQTVNPAMKLNKIYEANATQAINILKDFIKFDISESLTEFLQGEEAVLSVMKNDKKETLKNIELLENELRKIETIKTQNSLIAREKELIELQESIETEIQVLKDKWNQINLEISRFENKAKQVPSINEELGYPINTDIRIKRNGTKGKVIGVDGSSKTYTILFKEGKTGEYFFSDVENLSDEVDNYDITTPELELEYQDEITNEAKKNNQNFAEAPDAAARNYYDRKFMEMVKKNMAEAPDKKSNSQLAKSVSGKQKNSHIEKAPKGTASTPGKFIEKDKNANLTKAPGTNKKGGPKEIKNEKVANLAKAPGSKKK